MYIADYIYCYIIYIIILWGHCRICGPSLTEMSLCGAYLYLIYLVSRLIMTGGVPLLSPYPPCCAQV
jgi:hypothetical protein